MAGANTAVYTMPPVVSQNDGATESLWRQFSVKRTAASEELSIFEQQRIADWGISQWLDNPPVLQPSKTMQVQVAYTVGGRLDFPPLSEEDEQALKSTDRE